MAITTVDLYTTAGKQRVQFYKASRTTLAAVPFSTLDLAGTPTPPANLTLANTTAPTIQTSATTGYPFFNFSSGLGYLTKVDFGSSVAGRYALYDCLAKSGSYTFTAATTNIPAASRPDISGRCPDTTNWITGTPPTYLGGVGNEIWAEVSTLFVGTGTWTLSVTYTNSAGVTGRTSGSVATVPAATNLTLGRMFQIPLAAGDVGVQYIESVTRSLVTVTAGAANIMIMRPLWTNGRVPLANATNIHGILQTGMPIIYPTSALTLVAQPDSTASGTPELFLEISNG